jgi:hypothetical protein
MGLRALELQDIAMAHDLRLASHLRDVVEHAEGYIN